MAQQYSEISKSLQDFIHDQHIFFVGTAAGNGTVNISPKGMDSLRVLSSSKVVWMNLTGSGNETAAHLLKNDRMTIMFCSFEEKPMILRLYGSARMFHERDSKFEMYKSMFPKTAGLRQFVELDIKLVQTSCGFAVPRMEFKEDRNMLKSWAEKQGQSRLKKYWLEKNVKSLDGFETGIFENSSE